MSPSASIKQRFGVVTVEPAEPGGESKRIVVRRMAWSAQRQLFKKLATMVRDSLAARVPSDAPAGDMRSAIGLALGAALLRLPETVATSDELLAIVVLGSTDLTLNEFDKLDALAALEVIRVALELNFDDELKNSLAAIVNKVAEAVVAEKTKSSASSTPTSSMPATPPTT